MRLKSQWFEESVLVVNKMFDQNFYIIDEGRETDERSVIIVEDGHFRGYGYIDINDVKYGIEELKESIKDTSINPEVDNIIRHYMWSNDKIKVNYF